MTPRAIAHADVCDQYFSATHSSSSIRCVWRIVESLLLSCVLIRWVGFEWVEFIELGIVSVSGLSSSLVT